MSLDTLPSNFQQGHRLSNDDAFDTCISQSPPSHLFLAGVEPAVYLYSHNGDNFDLDTVELVETSPAARLHQAREDPADRFVVLPIGTVDYDHVLGQVLTQILHRDEARDMERSFEAKYGWMLGQLVCLVAGSGRGELVDYICI